MEYYCWTELYTYLPECSNNSLQKTPTKTKNKTNEKEKKAKRNDIVKNDNFYIHF